MFIADSQTLKDLGLFTEKGGILDLYSHTVTVGGRQLIKTWLLNPLTDLSSIRKRSNGATAAARLLVDFPFDSQLLAAVEDFLKQTETRASIRLASLAKEADLGTAFELESTTLLTGIQGLARLLTALKRFLATGADSADSQWQTLTHQARTLLTKGEFANYTAKVDLDNLPKASDREAVRALDRVIRYKYKEQLMELLNEIYRWDALRCLGNLAAQPGFSMAELLPSEQGSVLQFEGLRHPLLPGGTTSSFDFDLKNLAILTGAKMSGKSTLLKSLGLAVYLAHAGFPVAASHMRLTVMDGLYTTINLPEGYAESNFMGELRRIKTVAKALNTGKRIFALFDELFKSTNLMEAKEATTKLIERFTTFSTSLFFVSSHIVTVADSLEKRSVDILYRYLPTLMQDGRPTYTYKLSTGVSRNLHGLSLIRNEGIMELLKNNQPTIHYPTKMGKISKAGIFELKRIAIQSF